MRTVPTNQRTDTRRRSTMAELRPSANSGGSSPRSMVSTSNSRPDAGPAVCRGPRSPSPSRPPTRQLPHHKRRSLDCPDRSADIRSRQGCSRRASPSTTELRLCPQAPGSFEQVRPPRRKGRRRNVPECGATPCRPRPSGSYEAIVAFRCVRATGRQNRRSPPLECGRYPCTIAAESPSGYGDRAPRRTPIAHTPMRRFFSRRGVDKPTEGGLYTPPQVRRRLGVRSRLRSSSLIRVNRLPMKRRMLEASTGSPALRGWGLAIPGCLTSESEERETWTAESLRAASSGGD